MSVSSNGKKIVLNAPAKINLGLEVVRKRADGYHDIDTIMVPIDRFDGITLETGGEGVRCVCNVASVPTDGRNLCVKAALAFMERVGDRFGLIIGIDKTIPIGAGLGGGSSDAATTLMGLNELSENPLSRSELRELGVTIGSDVPFFIEGGARRAQGRGEILSPTGEIPEWFYVVAYPGFEVSAGWAYSNLSLTSVNKNHSIEYFLMEGVKLVNDLERAVIPSYPAVAKLKRGLEESGAKFALMSGSGPSVFGVFDDLELAEAAVKRLGSEPATTVFLARKHESGTATKGGSGWK